MVKIKTPRFFTVRCNGDGTVCYRWRPPAYLAALGFKDDKRLDDDFAVAVRQAEELNATVDAVRAGAAAPPVIELVPVNENHVTPGTVAHMCNLYRASSQYAALAPRGQETARTRLRRIEAEMGAEPIADVDEDDCIEWYDALNATGLRSMAFYTVKFARRLWVWARKVKELREAVRVNPWEAVDLEEPEAGDALLWSNEMIVAFVRAADILGYAAIGTAVIVNSWIGQRPADVYKIDWSHYRGGRFYVTQNKTKRDVVVGHSLLVERRLDWELARRGNVASGPIMLNRNTGEAYSRDAAVDAFNRVLKVAIAGDAALGLEPCPALKGAKFRWLRHTAVTRMAEAGATVLHIAAVSGHSFKTVEQIIEKYCSRTVALADAGLAIRAAADPLHSGEAWVPAGPAALPAPAAA